MTTIQGVTLATLTMTAALACSNSSSSTPAPINTCGAGPYVQVSGVVKEFQIGPYRDKEGVKITIDLCPEKSFTTDVDGKISVAMPKGKPFVMTLESPGDIPEVFEELMYDTDFDKGNAVVIPSTYQSIVAPQLAPDVALLALGVDFPSGALDAGPTNDCLKVEGVTWSVPGHPEAKIVYYNNDAVPKQDPALTATSASGIAGVTGLADGTIVQPAATKAGCTFTMVHDGFTGRAIMKKGYLTGFFGLMTK